MFSVNSLPIIRNLIIHTHPRITSQLFLVYTNIIITSEQFGRNLIVINAYKEDLLSLSHYYHIAIAFLQIDC